MLTRDELRWSVDPAFRDAYAPVDKGNNKDVLPLDGNVLPALPLHEVLAEFHPAVLAFPWDAADAAFSGAQACAATWKAQRVAPLTHFESSLGVYHASIIRELLPLRRSVHVNTPEVFASSAWYNAVLPFLFKSHALRFNAVRYSHFIASTESRKIVMPREDLQTT